jgi:hypothetical protein
MAIRYVGVDYLMITVVLSQRKWKKTISWSTTVGLFHILHSFPNHLIHIAMLSIANPIKYICKYVTKGSDIAGFGIQTTDINDEITSYKVARYVNCNEAIWRIFPFPNHTVIHWAVRLKNGQLVYFTTQSCSKSWSTSSNDIGEFLYDLP